MVRVRVTLTLTLTPTLTWLQVFAWRSSGRHKLIGVCGGLLEDLAPVRGRCLGLGLGLGLGLA